MGDCEDKGWREAGPQLKKFLQMSLMDDLRKADIREVAWV